MRRPTDQPRREPDRRAGDVRPPRPSGPPIPEWADPRGLDSGVRAALRGLEPRNADRVAAHLVAAGTLVDEDPEQALAHARAARDRASRVAAVREAVGVAAYQAGDYAEAARELRAYRRMSGDEGYRAVLADCERAQGRPEVALRLVAEAIAAGAGHEEIVELRLVEAGARHDLGERAAARLVLETALGGRPRPDSLHGADLPRLRLAQAYADLLRDDGDERLAAEWNAAIAAADPEDLLHPDRSDDVVFWDEELPAGSPSLAAVDAADAPVVAPVEVPADIPADVPAEGATQVDEAAQIEAEVAELLGEEPPAPAAEPTEDSVEH